MHSDPFLCCFLGLYLLRIPPAVSGLAAAEAVSQTDHGDCRRDMEGI